MRRSHALLAMAFVAAALLAGGQPAGTSKPIARIGDVVLTEEQLREELGVEVSQLEKRLYALRKYWAEGKIRELLFDKAAHDAGLSRADWEAREIDRKTTPPDETRTRALASRLAKPGAEPAEALKLAFEAILKENREKRREEVYEELVKKTKVELLVEKPVSWRIEVAYGPHDPASGNDHAPVTIVEFTDFQCPYCKRAVETLERVREAYPKEVRIVARQFPLEGHDRARPAAEAALCANEQGRYWEYRERLFSDQKKLSDADLRRHAKELGLDETKFVQCLSDRRYAEQVKKDLAEGKKYGVKGTPAFFVNGELISGAQPFGSFDEAIKTALEEKR
jgi:protein-disulfide isomerase